MQRPTSSRMALEALRFLFEKSFVVVTLLTFTGAVLAVLHNPNDINMGGTEIDDPLRFAIQTFVYAVSLIFILSIWRRIVGAIRMNPALTMLLAIAVVSCVWSGVPSFTLRRSIALIVTSLIGLYIGVRFSPRQQMRLFATTLLIACVLSVVFIVALPGYGTDIWPNVGSWRGAFLQKNILGRYMVFAAITFLCTKPSIGGLPAKVGKIALALVLLVGSRSAGSYVVMIVALGLIPAYRFLQLKWRRYLIVIIGVAAVTLPAAVFVALNAKTLIHALGKNATLTGRVPLWNVLLPRMAQHPLLGFGFSAFWPVEYQSVWASITGWIPLKAHNGYIDLGLELGAAGLILFGICTVISARRCLKVSSENSSLEAQWPLLMLSLILIYNLFESELLFQNSLLWTLYVTLSVSTQGTVFENRVQRVLARRRRQESAQSEAVARV
jgi:exopolysaccharide production protein ExoQ